MERNAQPLVNTPQFPGFQKGNPPEKVRAFIKDQVRRKGFRFSGGTTATDFQLQISGSARFLWGLALQAAAGGFTGLATLTINNEVVFENVDFSFLQFGTTNQDYFAVNRPLSGQDDVKLTLIGDIAYTNMPVVVVYK